MTYTPRPWRRGLVSDAIVAGQPEDEDPVHDIEHLSFYGGHVICESVEEKNINLIIAAPDMLVLLKEIDTRMCHNGSGDVIFHSRIAALIKKAEAE